MNEIQQFLMRWAQELKLQIRNELARPRTKAPGYNRDAYSNGRNQQYSGQFAISDQGDLWNSVNVVMIDDNYGFELEIADYYIYSDQGVRPQPQYLEGRGNGGQSAFITSLSSIPKLLMASIFSQLSHLKMNFPSSTSLITRTLPKCPNCVNLIKSFLIVSRFFQPFILGVSQKIT